MPGTNILMTAAFTGGQQNALAQIDCPLSGNITGVAWVLSADVDADQDFATAEVSFGSVYVLANDSRQVISIAGVGASQVTAASVVRIDTNYYDAMSLPVSAGERIYLHVNATASLPGTANAIIHFDFDIDRPQARRR